MTLLFLPFLLPFTYGSNILVWNPTLGHSHVRFMGNIADILSKEGHNVTIFSPHVDPRVTPFGNKYPATTIQFNSPYNNNDDWMKMEIIGKSLWEMPPVEGMCLSFDDWDIYTEVVHGICRGLLDDKNLLHRLRESKFDIALHETYDLCSVGIFEVLGISKTIALSALGMTAYLNEVAGLPPLPSFIPGK
uniref:glucuronosyltransferase n=1 Tax=Heterorhabditis bacteriophora TaxID=37862 RepID=A0A1I7XA18_HETBA